MKILINSSAGFMGSHTVFTIDKICSIDILSLLISLLSRRKSGRQFLFNNG